MKLDGRRAGAVLVACVIVCAVPSYGATPPRPLATPGKLQRLERAIAIAVNGVELPRHPAPRIVGKGGGLIVVPVVKIFAALGIAVSRSGDTITATAPDKQIVLRIGSARATIDRRPVLMERPAVTIDGATYVPLRFVADALGAQVSFDPRARRVEVVSSLVGRTPSLEQPGRDGTSQIVGAVTAVDLNSTPGSITLQRGSSIRTLPITARTRIEVQDVVARTSMPGQLYEVHVGDAASVIVGRDGQVDAVVIRYASRNGTIAAVSPNAFVLDKGFVVTPDKATAITLDGRPATLADLQVGDEVTVRLNPDTDEERQIIVARAIPPSPSISPGPVRIDAFGVTSNAAALRAGDAFDVTLHGTPGGRATYDIGAYLTGLPMIEVRPGIYTARYTVPPNVNFGLTSVYGELTVGVDRAHAQAPTLIAVSNTPPQIVDIAPPGGRTLNNNRPSIYATYRSSSGVGIDASSVSITVDGLDVTDSTTRTDQFVTYRPSVALGDGPVEVSVRVADRAGNVQTRSWTFTIRTR